MNRKGLTNLSKIKIKTQVEIINIWKKIDLLGKTQKYERILTTKMTIQALYECDDFHIKFYVFNIQSCCDLLM